MSTPKRIFISYGHDEQAALARRLAEDLTRRGHGVWFDEERLSPGSDWEARIEKGLDWACERPGAGRIVLLMTPHSVRRPDGYCLNEIARALHRRLVVVPVMVVWCEPPLSICRIQWLDMQDCVPIQERQERYEVKLVLLAEALEEDRLDFEGIQSRLLHWLEPLPFEADIAQHLARFTGRRWVFDRIDAWLADPNAQRVFWIVGRPGIGKTAISCWLCSHRREIAAFHFCCHGHTQKSDPRRCVLSIAYQLSTQLPDYQTRLSTLNLERIVPESNARTLFDQLIVQPLAESFPQPDRPIVLLIDALDEATEGGKNELAALIASELEKTPGWLRLILTSRPDSGVELHLPALIPYRLDSAPENNEEDLRAYLSRELKPHAPDGTVPPSIIDAIVARCEGIFLYVEWFCRELNQRRLSLDRPNELPQGLGGIYARMCMRQFADLGSYQSDILPALEVVSAAQEPMEARMIASILGWNEYRKAAFRRSVAALFPLADGPIQPFHTSLMEWLTDEHRAGRYFVSVREGHQRLADSGWRQYQGGVAALSGYLRSHLPAHLGKAERWDDLETILADPTFVKARCEAGRIFDLVADVAAAARAGRPLESISAALIEEVFRKERTEGFRQQLRSALNQFFGPYSDWPQALRAQLEESDRFSTLLFLGDTLDMEVRYEEAERVFRKMLAITGPADAPGHSTACVRLAMVLDHQDRKEEGLRLLDGLVSQPGAKERYAESYWWAQYHRGIFLHQLYRYDEAKAVLEGLRSEGGGKGLATSALHQLGTIDMELGEFDQAEE